jgi:hypothetical protein
MEDQLIFGTYNVPPITNESLTATYTTQNIFSKSMLEKIYAAEKEIIQEEIGVNSYSEALKALRKVKKP